MHYFSGIITRDDGFPRKPAPEGLLQCVKAMGVPPEHAVIVGDTLLDVRAGKMAGTLTVGVLTGLAGRELLEAQNPTAVVDDAHAFLALLNMA
jgi:phosphoglycolate phosphatase-like HAD superfamily hydrolase